jgi:putative nucleotidyltransferase with HDIG domain
MGPLPWKARLYILLLTALAASAVLFSVFNIGNNLDMWAVVLIAAVAVALLDAFPIVPLHQVEITISNSAKFAVLLLYPPPVVILGAFLGTALYELRAKRSTWVKKVFNVSEMAVTWLVVAWVYALLHQPQVDYFGSIQNVIALIGSGLVDFVVNSVMVCLVISFAVNLPFRYIWLRNLRQVIWHELSIIPLGTIIAVLWQFNPVSIVLAALPLEVVRRSYKIVNDLQRQTQEALSALVRVIDERDHHTLDHSERVSQYARKIAEALDLPQEDIDAIASAALLHDVGKVGMADDILFNPKILNPQERKHAQEHAEIGAMLLSKFPLFDKGAVLVKHHHERYDGTGYPENLKGKAIPLGSRVISVADAYQAMTEDRPYRRALSVDQAIAQLVAGSGTQFDPEVVQAFAQVLRQQVQENRPAAVGTPKPQTGATG